MSFTNQKWRLIQQMTVRDIKSRYRGSTLGFAWSFFNPIIMLIIYTFVFSVIFEAKWGTLQTENQSHFSLILFSGLIVYNLFAETINRSPTLILSNPNFVKKVVFPLHILPVINILSNLFHMLINILVLILATLVYQGWAPWTLIFLPIVTLPLIIMTLGISWFLSALGVYLRDINQFIGLLTTAMLFLSPVFFSIAALPEHYQAFFLINPLTFIIEQFRAISVWGTLPNFMGLIGYTSGATLIAAMGFFWFQKTQKGFADVI